MKHPKNMIGNPYREASMKSNHEEEEEEEEEEEI